MTKKNISALILLIFLGSVFEIQKTNALGLEIFKKNKNGLTEINESSQRGLLERHPKIRKSLGRLLRKKKPNEKIRVIIQYTEFPDEGRLSRFRQNTVLKRTFKYQPFVAVELNGKEILELIKDDLIRVIEPDYEMKILLDASPTQIKAPDARSKYGYSGKNIKVAVIDTGIATNHPALQGKVVAAKDFSDDGVTEDLHGHGTNVACIISCNDKTFTGVAPDSVLINAKVLNKDGSGNASDLMAGIEWAIDANADIINMSLGAPISECNGNDSISKTVEAAIAKGIIAVVAAGNEGPFEGTLSTPGCAEAPITVGAVNDYNKIAYFSSRGPTSDGRVKPDIVAPGVEIVAAAIDGGWSAMSGTSQATPHIAGLLALMHESKGDLNQEQAKEILKNTAIDIGATKNEQGEGLVDAVASVSMASVDESTNEELEQEEEIDETPKDEGEEAEETDKNQEESQEEETNLSEEEKETIDNLASCLDQALLEQNKKDACFEQFIHDQENIEHDKLNEEEILDEEELAEIMMSVDEELGETYTTAEIKELLGTYLYTENSLSLVKSMLEDLLTHLLNDDYSEKQVNDEVSAIAQKAGDEKAVSRMDKFKRKMIEFKDVDNDTWFLYYVRDLKEKKCVNGYKDASGILTGDYGPGNPLTVAEALKINLECTGHAESSASDSPSNSAWASHWAAAYFVIAEDLGLSIMTDLENPDRPIKRSEATRLVLETFNQVPDNTYQGVFSDVPEDHPEAIFIEFAWSKEVVSGDAFKTTFRPNDPINRAEITKVVRQAVEAF